MFEESTVRVFGALTNLTETLYPRALAQKSGWTADLELLVGSVVMIIEETRGSLIYRALKPNGHRLLR
jgi:hypothetical protein